MADEEQDAQTRVCPACGAVIGGSTRDVEHHNGFHTQIHRLEVLVKALPSAAQIDQAMGRR